MAKNVEIIEKLKKGNEVYVVSKANPGDISAEIRKDTAENGQHPYAIVVTCADSRVVPEHIFSCGLGELFTIRVAGNIVGESELGSIEYAAGHLHSKVVIILGHTNCGAVGAAIEGVNEGFVSCITKRIRESIGEEKDGYKASAINAKTEAAYVKEKLTGHHEISMDDMDIIPAVYDIKTGKVEWL